MKVITLAVPDEKYPFLMDIINKLDFVEVQSTPQKQKTIQDMQEALTELHQVLAGKKKTTPFKDFLAELKTEE